MVAEHRASPSEHPAHRAKWAKWVYSIAREVYYSLLFSQL